LFDFRISSVSVSENHVCASDSKGRLYSWGTSIIGETGIDEIICYTPTQVKVLTRVEVKEVKVAPCLTVIKSSSGHLHILGEIGGFRDLNLGKIKLRKIEELSHLFIEKF